MEYKPIPAIPRCLNGPYKWGFWTTGELILMLILFIVFAIFGAVGMGVVIGIFLVAIGRKLQRSSRGNLLKRGKYAFLPFSRYRYKVIPNSDIKEFIG